MPHFTECLSENCFTWCNAETGEEVTFASDRMQPWATEQGLPVLNTPVEAEWARLFCRDRGVEQHRLSRLTPQAFTTPVIYCEMHDGSHLLVDGTHRYVYAAITGRKHIPAYILTPDQWERFIITGLPQVGDDTLRRMHSGIK